MLYVHPVAEKMDAMQQNRTNCLYQYILYKHVTVKEMKMYCLLQEMYIACYLKISGATVDMLSMGQYKFNIEGNLFQWYRFEASDVRIKAS